MIELREFVDAAIALTRGAVRFHAGVAYRVADGGQYILHLAGHLKVRATVPDHIWAYVSPAIDPMELQVVAANCKTLADVQPEVPYGLASKGHFEDGGAWVPSPGDSGLTCATFVLKVFDWSGVSLVDESSWESRESDAADQARLVTWLKDARNGATAEHIAAVENDLGCVRVRPEEVGAASSEDRGARPVSFRRAEVIGAEVREALEGFLGSRGL